MRAFTPGELAGLRKAQEAAMMDRCTILAYHDGTPGAYGKPRQEYIPGANVACGYDATARKEVMDGAQTAITDARLRLPLGTAISHLDRLRITHRLGVLLDTQPVYEIIGEPRQGPSGLLLNLRSVTDHA